MLSFFGFALSLETTQFQKCARRSFIEDIVKFNELEGSGYVVDCIKTALEANKRSSYEEVVKAAIAFGNDTDTTACVAGGIAGIKYGFSSIPERFIRGLRSIDKPLEMLNKLEVIRQG